MTYGIDHGVHDIKWVGTRAATGEMTPGFGTWEVIDHQGCAGDGALRALGRGYRVPHCPVCGAAVTWQLTHLAASVAADHPDEAPLP